MRWQDLVDAGCSIFNRLYFMLNLTASIHLIDNSSELKRKFLGLEIVGRLIGPLCSLSSDVEQMGRSVSAAQIALPRYECLHR